LGRGPDFRYNIMKTSMPSPLWEEAYQYPLHIPEAIILKLIMISNRF
jgi:hypothetical protein